MRIARYIQAKGIKSWKKHGEYRSLEMFDGWELKLDTWNWRIYTLKNGEPRGSLGIDFGGFECDIRMVRFWSAHLSGHLNVA